MGHSPELIEKIKELLFKDYPADQYRYEIERSLPTNQHMRPDIQILDRANNCVCVVEIGYTRPEKLTAYRESYKIFDVRWYAKDGTLHTTFERPIVRAQLEISPGTEFRVYEVLHIIDCSECLDEWFEEDPDDPDDEADLDDEYVERAFKDASDCVLTTIVTDCIKAFVVSFCDKCGRWWLADQEHHERGVSDLCDELRNLNIQSWKLLGAIKHRGSWANCQHYFAELEQKPNYIADGIWLVDKKDYQDQMVRLVRVPERV